MLCSSANRCSELSAWSRRGRIYIEGLVSPKGHSSGGRKLYQHSETRSLIFTTPTHMTVSAPPQYNFSIPSSSEIAPQVKTTLGTYSLVRNMRFVLI